METILNVLSIVSGVVTPICMVLGAIRTVHALKNGEVEVPFFASLDKSFEKNQSNSFSAVQYIAWRRSLKLLARQHAKKRARPFFKNLTSLSLALATSFLYLWARKLLLSLSDEEIANLQSISLLSPDIISAACNAGSLVCGIISIVFFVVSISFALLFPFNVSSWDDLKKQLRERKHFKQSVKEGYYKPISQVIDIASHFDTYLLFDADPRDTVFEDGVIGTKSISENESICDMIESCLSEKPSKKLAVFTYSQYGKASYERTKEARSVYEDVFDLGPVCGDMRDLEIVAHQLLYLKDEGCLRLPY